MLLEVQTPKLQRSVLLLKVHSLGAEGRRADALAAFQSLQNTPSGVSQELLEELHHRYLNGGASQHDDDWVIHEEIQYLLKVA